MGSLQQDIRYSLRTFGHSPGFAAVAVVTLALGIGANTAIFTLLNALLLSRLPAWRPQRLVWIAGIYRNGSKVPFSFPMLRELERRQRVFSGLFGWTDIWTFNVEVNAGLSLAGVRAVTGNYYSELGATPLLGRLIAPVDAGRKSASQVAVISFGFWRDRFGRDPGVVGRTIRVEGHPFTIIGVSQRWFTGMTPGECPEVTIPIGAAPVDNLLESHSRLWVFVAGRLNDGITTEQARAQLQSSWPELLAATVPTESAGHRRESFLSMRLDMQSAATGIQTDLRSRFTQPLYLLMAVVALVLLIACVNLANLTLARAAARAHEITVRAVLGASRWLIARQLLTEGLLFSSSGALLALAFASWGSRLLVGLMAERTLVPIVLDLRPDWHVFSFTATVGLLAGVLIGLAPAWQVARVEPASVLRQDGRTLGRGTGGLMSKALIVSQIALSVVLLLGAGLLLRSLQRLFAADAGFEKVGVFEVSLYPRPGGYENLEMNSYREQLIDRILTLPGLLSASYSYLPVPAGESGWGDTVSPTAGDSSQGAGVLATLAPVSPSFFKTLAVPLIYGRDFDWADDEHHPPVAIIDSSLARRILPSGDVIGQRIRFGVHPEFQDLQIVGVVGTARVVDPHNANSPVIYVPFMQHETHLQYGQQGYLFARANHPDALAGTVEKAVASLGHEYSAGVRTMEQMYEGALVLERAASMLSGFFAAVALLLAGIGLFGLMAYSVTQRTREIGIRMALGAQRASILRMILCKTLLLTLLGVGIGLPCALAAARLIAHMLFVSPEDPLTLGTVSAVLLAVGTIAGYLPARTATKLDPMVALRYE
jgi:predicted permease